MAMLGLRRKKCRARTAIIAQGIEARTQEACTQEARRQEASTQEARRQETTCRARWGKDKRPPVENNGGGS